MPPLALQCAVCGVGLEPRERVGRLDACTRCGAELHACRQCSFYDPAVYNECREPQAERVVDKELANFCDYFAPRPAGGAARPLAAGAGRAGGGGTARVKLEDLFRKK
jgi:hypothetical protein